MIDWTLAARVARLVAGNAPAPSARAPRGLAPLAAEAQRRVRAYTGIAPVRPLPAAEGVDRPAWVDANLARLRALLDPVAERMGDGLGPLRGPMRGSAGLLLAVEVGALAGWMAQRVLGQYDVALLDPAAPSRLLFVTPNLVRAAQELGADEGEVLAWVALHEVTHGLQLDGVPWLREHLAALVRELLATLEVSVDPGALLRLPGPEDVRDLVRAVRDGGLVALAAGRGRAETLDRLQATMALLEGHAEHVMDAAAGDLVPSLPRLREALELRREASSPALALLRRLLGLDLKLRQYRDGRAFCEAVVAAGGIDALNRVWQGAEALPTLAEISDPAAWMRRTHVPAVTS